MPGLGRATKELLVTDIRAKMSGSRHVFMTTFKIFSPAASTKLRRQLRGAKASCVVAKRTLLIRALAETPFSAAGAWATGPTAMILADGDPVVVSKALLDFMKDNETALEITGAIVEGQSLSRAQIVALAKLPSRQQLLAQVVGGIQSPLYGLVGVLNGLLRQCVSVIAQIQKQKEDGSHG